MWIVDRVWEALILIPELTYLYFHIPTVNLQVGMEASSSCG